jgi:hypothetical protein
MKRFVLFLIALVTLSASASAECTRVPTFEVFPSPPTNGGVTVLQMSRVDWPGGEPAVSVHGSSIVVMQEINTWGPPPPPPPYIPPVPGCNRQIAMLGRLPVGSYNLSWQLLDIGLGPFARPQEIGTYDFEVVVGPPAVPAMDGFAFFFSAALLTLAGLYLKR